MGKRMHRAQILLEFNQHQALADFARREGRSISAVVRAILAGWLADQEIQRGRRRQLAAGEALQGIRETIQGRYRTLREDRGAGICPDLVG